MGAIELRLRLGAKFQKSDLESKCLKNYLNSISAQCTEKANLLHFNYEIVLKGNTLQKSISIILANEFILYPPLAV